MKNRFPYTELQMCDALETALRHERRLPVIGEFSGVFREVSCRQGQPDFLLTHQEASVKESSFGMYELTRADVLSHFPPNRPISKSILEKRVRVSPSMLNRILERLIDDELIVTTESGAYQSALQSLPIKTELWAIEVKLNNPRRAIFQAQQAKLYADRVIIVVPPNQARNYAKWHDPMRLWGIGLLEFDPVMGLLSTIRRSRKSPPLSRHIS